MKWRVILNGDPLDLKMLAESFTKAEALIRNEGDNYTLSSSEFESPVAPENLGEHVKSVTDKAKAIVEWINGALVLALGSNVPVTMGAAYELGPKGDRKIYLSMHAQAHCRAFAVGQVVHPDGTVEESRPADPVRNWSELAARDKAVADVLCLIGTKPSDWVNLYRVYEIVKEDSGGIERRGWATEAAIRAYPKNPAVR
jgi:hypothetical protein